MPVDPHPKFPKKSALEVIMTTLHSGGKFDSKVYETSGGLHGVGVSVVNALSGRLEVEVARAQTLHRQTFRAACRSGKLETVGRALNRRGTSIRFHPDAQIFGKEAAFHPAAALPHGALQGLSVRRRRDPLGVRNRRCRPTARRRPRRFSASPTASRTISPSEIDGKAPVADAIFAGKIEKPGRHGAVEWAIAWLAADDGFTRSYCNTIPTPEGGTHEQGLRAALLRACASMPSASATSAATLITADDVLAAGAAMLSVFIREPEFQGQTKERCRRSKPSAWSKAPARPVRPLARRQPAKRASLLDFVVDRADERLRRRAEKEVARKRRRENCACLASSRTARGLARRARSCSSSRAIRPAASAKQARNRETQAILPLRGKILNVASAGRDKLAQNQQLSDLVQALGCGIGANYRDEELRYDKVIMMTDADVDGAHIASLLITFFWRQMPKLIAAAISISPCRRSIASSHGGKTVYARDDADREELPDERPSRATPRSRWPLQGAWAR